MSKVVKINKMDVDRAAGKDPVFSEQEIPAGTVIKMSFGGESSSTASNINVNAKRFKNLKNYVEARRSGTC